MMANAGPERRFAFHRAVMALILREMSSTYGRSPGGYVWAVVEPVAGIAILSVVFNFIVRTPPLGESFPVFFATGLLTLATYQSLATKVGMAIKYSRPLLAYPRVTYIDAIISRIVLTFLTNVIVFVIIMTGLIWTTGQAVSLDYLAIANAFGMVLALGTGIGLVNCLLMSMFPIWQFIWAVINRPMFIISGAVFLIDTLPREARDLLMLNPVAHAVSMMRAGFYGTYDAPYVSSTYVYMVALALAAFGMLMLHRYHRVILDEGA